jgi:hypothetical protein
MPRKTDELIPTAGKFRHRTVIRGTSRDEILKGILLDISGVRTRGD